MDLASSDDFGPLFHRLGYRFVDTALLVRALTHKSWCNERQGTPELREDNERLEFLGDAVLGLVVSDLLMQRFPDRPEGELSKLRAALVNEAGLCRVAQALRIGDWIYLGRGEEQGGGRSRASILANAVEALVGAVYQDGGFVAAFHVVRHIFAAQLDGVLSVPESDFKSRLQELVQGRLRGTLTYEVVAEHGPDHGKEFEVAVLIDGRELARAQGRSKKAAQQAAAERALDVLRASEGL